MIKVMNSGEVKEFVGEFIHGVQKGFVGGSSVTVYPPVLDTDVDVFILIWDSLDITVRGLRSNGWTVGIPDEYDGKSDYTDTFRTVRKGDLNLLLFTNPEEFGAVLGATSMVKLQNIKSKSERYELFAAARSPWR